ncbi:MAG: hypothetical protein J0H74_16165 [Chitinophagaceae bacterium]|nr:hypothetical protein [Chitinophagaceae bacterium]
MENALLPNIKLAEERKEKVSQLFFQIEKHINTGNKSEAINILQELNSYVEKSYDIEYFYEYWGWTDAENMIFNISLPENRNIKISKEDLIEILDLIISNDTYSDYYINLVINNFAYGDKVMSLIGKSMPVEEMAQTIITYRPIML